MTHPDLAIRRLLAVLVCAVVAAAAWLKVWADAASVDPLTDLRARTAALTESDLASRFAAAADPVDKAGLSVMLAERLVRRDLRGEIDRIAGLFASADAPLAAAPDLRAEAALFGARILALESRHAQTALARLRAALASKDLTPAARTHAEFGLAFLVPEAEEAHDLFTGIVRRDPGSPYAVPAARAAIERAPECGRAESIVELALALDGHASETDRAELLRNAAVSALVFSGVPERYRFLPGQAMVRLHPPASPKACGLLLGLSPLRAIHAEGSVTLHEGELDHVALAKHWQGAAPADLLAGLPAGRYLALLADGSDITAEVYELSTLALEVRLAPNLLLAFASDARDGSPRAGVRILGRHSNERSAEIHAVDGVTDAGGILRIPLDHPLNAGESLYVMLVAALGAEQAAIDEALDPGAGASDGCRIALFASKPLVRPGETIEYRLAARVPGDAGKKPVPAGARFTVSLESASGDTLANETLTVSEFGTADAKLAVPADASPGLVSARVESLDPGLRIRDPNWSDWSNELEEYRQPLFRIDEYRLGDLLVEVKPDQTGYCSGSTAVVTVKVQAAAGGAVAGFEGEVVAEAFGDRWWSAEPEAALPFVEAPADSRRDAESAWDSISLELPEGLGRFTTDAQGMATVRLPLHLPRWHDMVRVYFTATGRDRQGREATGKATARLAREPGRVALDIDWRTWPTAVLRGTAVPVDLADKPVRSPVTLIARRWDWAAGGFREVARRELAAGTDSFEFTGLPYGSYRLEASATVADRAVTSETWWWCWEGEKGREPLRAEKLTLRNDRWVYRPGETLAADAVVPDGVKAVFATLEGETIHAARSFPVVWGVAQIAFALPVEAAPNVRLRVVSWRDGAYLEGELVRYIDAGSNALSVTVDANPHTAKPGAEASWTVKVRDAQGRPVDAEVSLAVVDERVYRMQEDPAPGLARRFAPRPRRYCVAGTHADFFHEPAADGKSIGGVSACFSEGPSGPPEPPRVRRDLRDLLAWIPSLRTGPSGDAVVKVPFSDSLTPWRATARAFTREGGAGEARGEARTWLPLAVELSVPRVLRAGDEVEVTANVRNATETEAHGTVRLEAEGLAEVDGAPRPVTIPAGGTATCAWKVRPGKGERATVRVLAACGELGDAIEKTIELQGAQVRVPFSDHMLADGTHAAAYALASPRDPERAEVEVRAAPEELMRLLEPLQSLLEYPHGCVEQTMSTFLPAVVVRTALDRLGVRLPVLETQGLAVTHSGLGRLAGFRHADGGWGWWTGDESDPFMTTYVVYGLLLARDSGVEVDARLISGGLDRLEAFCTMVESKDDDAFLRYVLARGGRALPDKPIALNAEASAAELAFAARTALLRHDDATAKAIRAQLIALAERGKDGTATWNGGDHLWRLSGVATALAVEALLEADPKDETALAGVRWLDAHRTGDGYGSTLANSFAALACARHLASQGLKAGNTTAVLWLDGKPREPDVSTPGDPVRRWRIRGTEIPPTGERLEIHTVGERSLRVTVRGADYLPPADLPPAAEGWTLTRTLERLADGLDPSDDRSWAPVEPGEPVVVGRTYRVSYQVSCPEATEYLALIDPRPAGLEPAVASGPLEPEETGSAYLEVHADRIGLFQREAGGGATLHVPVHFDTPGAAAWPPARAFAMYDEGQQAFSAGETLRVLPAVAAEAAKADPAQALADAKAWLAAGTAEQRDAEHWLALPLDLNANERKAVRDVVRACRANEGVWSGVGESLLAACLRLARADDDEDVRLLLDLPMSPNPDEWPDRLRTPIVWLPFEATLARLAVDQDFPPAWAALRLLHGVLPNPESVLTRLEQASPAQRAACLDGYVSWLLALPQSHDDMAVVGMVVDQATYADRFLPPLREWLAAHAGAIDVEVIQAAGWVAARCEEKAREPKGVPETWVAARAEVLQRIATADPGDDATAQAIGDLPHCGPILESVTRMALKRNQDAGWAILSSRLQAWDASPFPALGAFEGAPPAERAAALEKFVDTALPSLVDSARRNDAPEQRAACSTRLRSLVESWLGARSARAAELDEEFWNVLAAVRDLHSIDPSFETLEKSFEQRFDQTDPLAPGVAVALERHAEPFGLDPTIRVWILPHLRDLALHAPLLALIASKPTEADERQELWRSRIAEFPADQRRALVGAALGWPQGASEPAWLRTFLHDPESEVRRVAETHLITAWANGKFDELVDEFPALVIEHLGDRNGSTIRMAAGHNLEAAVPVLMKLFAAAPDTVLLSWKHLAGFRLPAIHPLLVTLRERVTSSEAGNLARLNRAELLTRPVSTTTDLLEIVKGLGERPPNAGGAGPWDEDVKALGRYQTADAVRKTMTDGEDPDLAAVLALGAAERRDPEIRAGWQADLARTDARRDIAVIGLAHDDPRAGGEILVTWLVSEVGRAFLATLPGVAGAPAEKGETIDPAWFDRDSRGVDSNAYPHDAARCRDLLAQSLWQLATRLPEDLSGRLIAGSDVPAISALACAWLRTAGGNRAHDPALLAAAASLTERILTADRTIPEPALAALSLLDWADLDALHRLLIEASDRRLAACARIPLETQQDDLVSRLWAISRGKDEVAARFARAALDHAGEEGSRESIPALPAAPRMPPLTGPGAPANPFATPMDDERLAGLRARFGEDPLAAPRR